MPCANCRTDLQNLDHGNGELDHLSLPPQNGMDGEGKVIAVSEAIQTVFEASLKLTKVVKSSLI